MRLNRIAITAGLLLASTVTSTVLGISPAPVVRDQHWPDNSSGVYQSGFIFPQAVVTDVTIGGILDHIEIPISAQPRISPPSGDMKWFIYDAKNNAPISTTPLVAGTIPFADVDGSVTIVLGTHSLHYQPGDQFAFAIQGDGGSYSWNSYRGFDAKLHREYRLMAGHWTLDDPPLNPPPSYALGYSTYIAIPEPASFLHLMVGLPFLYRRRSRNRPHRMPLESFGHCGLALNTSDYCER